MTALFANTVLLALLLEPTSSFQVSATSHGFRGTSLNTQKQEPGAPAAADDFFADAPAASPYAAASPFAAAPAGALEAIPDHINKLREAVPGIPGIPEDAVNKLKPNLPEKPLLSPAMWVLLVFAPGSALLGFLFVMATLRMDEHISPADTEVVERTPDHLDEDVYGAGIATLVRDSYNLVAGKGDLFLRLSRLAASFGLMVFVVCLQIIIILQMQALVAARAVTVIREIYDRFEFVMYGSDESHCYLTANGFHRGKSEEYFNIANFDKLNDGEKESCCSIPFSQMGLLVPILFIWSLTIVSDLRRCGDLFVRLIISTPTVASMKDSTEDRCCGEEHLVVGLTKEVKGLLLFTCIIPRFFIGWYLLWLGCRWLAATPSFTDLLLNSVALEFVVLLKDALYVAAVPDRNKRATQTTMIQPWSQTEPANYRVFLSSFALIGAAYAWVYYYIYRFQAVLPDYRWDVHDTCMAYIEASTSGKAN
eukprot:TRINITY_DN20302_c0_g2_i1.p1 TRINITY_DN20302_c0_g2~~TRINITY_DN20302_c0_g2_i1.p1  ORF type:complete len:480 (-),score=79.45 TRINITY_DN20302_c0_g2_i1:130-1569(-)